ncbi:glycosyltransferase [Acetivibrio cellulolyticus]|uniref:glycosyltransferase n=1 Tax=Acetivibrio cellulolyticus TaxID=35830 RepID=UPI0001E3017C|nr:glycosyltransferase [Acetivibrio cellulolyticus]
METIKIVTSSDDRYVQHLGIMLISLLMNTASRESLEFFVIDGGITDKNKEILASIVGKYGLKMHFLQLSPERYQSFNVMSYFGQATFFRIFVTDLFDPSVEKIVFLDCDMIIKGDIAELWKTDVSGYYMAAVEDVGLENDGLYGIQHKRSLGIKRRSKYFNAGVMVINMTLWRNHNIPDRTRNYLLTHHNDVKLPDQDALNAVLCDNWKLLHPKWNQQATLQLFYKKKWVIREDLLEAVHNPAIIHYSEPSKPWHYMNLHPMKKEYLKYTALSPWMDFTPSDLKFKNRIKKLLLRTRLGQAVAGYCNNLNLCYEKDSEYLNKKLSKSPLFKAAYFVFFPIGYNYNKRLSKLAGMSYYIENGKININNRVLSNMACAGLSVFRFLIPGPLRNYLREESVSKKYMCPCCGYKTFVNDRDDEEICKICFWQNDIDQVINPNYDGGANEVSLSQARKNYLEFGASDKRYMFVAQKPTIFDEKDIHESKSGVLQKI